MKLSRIWCNCVQNVNKFAQRTHNCGQLRLQNDGERVKLKGWVSYKRFNKFMVLKDSYGATQVVVPEHLESELKHIRPEFVVEVEGVVVDRGDQKNQKMATGEIEVVADKLEVLNTALAELPLHTKMDSQEKTKQMSRYMNLRSEKLQSNLRLRSQIIHNMRSYLIDQCGFVDVETPVLSQWTPGGAHEFIVPSGQFPGQFYSLPQSPQVFKQLLMVGGIDRYFQVAKCFRDEGSMLDRQPEFTQLDLEMSFATQDDVIGLVEGVLRSSWPSTLPSSISSSTCSYLSLPFRRMTYDEVMSSYGSDKPDLRIPWKFVDCTEEMSVTNLKTTDDWNCNAFIAKGAVEYDKRFKRTEWKRLIQTKHSNARWRAVNLHKENPFKNFNAESFKSKYEVNEDDIVVFSWGDLETSRQALGMLRNFVGEVCGLRSSGFEFLWVVDFPLFRMEDGSFHSSHHPFTAPTPADLQKLKDEEDLLDIKALHYDLVMNGAELGGGSVRIHNSELQKHVINLLQLPEAPLEGLLKALSLGAPPHAGFALGIDRYMALLAANGGSSASIKDVIAFPKTKEGRCLTTGAPSEPPSYVLDRYFVQVVKQEEKNEKEVTKQKKRENSEAVQESSQ
ncbi:unnamed protein product [Bursaphelenchus okinawaensis]|uniref:Aminoacyl-transfer RNA synthetases class-II family profile domain-containing protein n=1 Tax=Bursaphelenchus okinawaensis TaxID=465554 RepID=A0A811LAI2_9BILA|nr:unnamed protein product [Bursaphelenchus okinawaensis]CAG9120110.1 unnamed protein product [Bursaphelenchus okinawaensis]